MRPDGGSVGPAWTEAPDDAQPPAPAPEVRYVEGGELGRGGMGVVEAVRDTWLDRDVARKRPLAHLGPAAHAGFTREARVTAGLDHPGIVPILDVGVDARGPYYTMPVLDGVTLGRALREPERGLPALVRVVEAVARAVAFAHTRGVVHRDLKPDNVLIGAFGEVRVLDWGVALDPRAPDARPVGTEGFQAPEQRGAAERREPGGPTPPDRTHEPPDGRVAPGGPTPDAQDRGRTARLPHDVNDRAPAGGPSDGRVAPVGPAADVYALGRVLAEVLAAREAPPALAAVVTRATDPDPARRYPEAGAFADELARWLDGRRVEAHRYTPWELAVALLNAWRGRVIAAAAVAAVAAVALAAWTTTVRRERDRAVAAERQSRAARSDADTALARALHLAAAARLAVDARPAAEVLAARALALQDGPEARGVWMAWYGLPRPARVADASLACPDATLAAGAQLCVDGGQIRVIRDGAEAWRGDLGPKLVRGARFDGRTAVVVHLDTSGQIWRDGRRIGGWAAPETTLMPASGHLALRDGARVGHVEGDGSVRWTPRLCDRVEDAWSDGRDVAAVCADESLVLGGFDGVREVIHLGHPPSAVTRDAAGRWVVGTFDGLLLTAAPGGRGARSEEPLADPSGVGAVDQLVPWGARVVVTGEDQPPRVWDAATGAFHGGLPARGRVQVDTDLWVTGDGTTRWSAPGPAVGRWTRGGGGGVSFLAVSEAGDALLGGNSSGDVTWWSPTTGEATPVAAGCANVAKAGVVLGDRALASQIDCPSPMLQIDRRSGALTRSRSLPALDGELPTLHARVLERWGDALVIAGYSPRVDVLSPDRAVHVDGWTVAASPARDLWLLDLDGVVKAVRPDGRVEALASAPGAADLAALGDGVVVIAGRAVTALDASGGVRWTWEAPGDLTRVDAGDGRVVVGDADGQIHVLSDGGALLATARGHRRRISEVRVVGDVAYTASWDATVRRWGLGAAEAPREALIALAGAWGLSVDEAQRAPP